MKYKVDWSSPRQGIQSTMVDALNMTAAKEQVDSMYAHIDGFKVFCVSPVFEKEKTYQSYEQQPIKVQLVESSDVGSDDDISATIAAGFIIVGGILIFLGMFNLPVGIFAMILGGGLGWLGWKIGCWMNDKWGI